MTKINEMDAYKYTGITNTNKSKGVEGSETSEAFMGLLLAQMKNQSPMDPMDDNAMISQMAQLNSLQELQSINTSLKGMMDSNNFLSATGMIGKYAKYATLDDEGKTIIDDKGNMKMTTGKVSAVTLEGGVMQLTIAGKSVSFATLTEVSDTEIVLTDEEKVTATDTETKA